MTGCICKQLKILLHFSELYLCDAGTQLCFTPSPKETFFSNPGVGSPALAQGLKDWPLDSSPNLEFGFYQLLVTRYLKLGFLEVFPKTMIHVQLAYLKCSQKGREVERKPNNRYVHDWVIAGGRLGLSGSDLFSLCVADALCAT